MAYDLVVRGGTVLDGTGGPRYRADVGIRRGRIALIGRAGARGREEIDATGMFVTPGFIDGHTHLDAQMHWDHVGASSCLHGVTTVLNGNCGFTLAPCRSDQADLVFRSLERAEEIPREAMLAGVKWDWETFPEYLDSLDRLPMGINYGALLGHSSLRTHVMGERAFEEAAGDDDLKAMKHELESALRAGAMGFSTSRSSSHMTADDRPVASRLAAWHEVQELVGVMGDLGAGLFELDHEKHPAGPEREEYFTRLRDLGIASGRPVFFMMTIPPAEPLHYRERLAYLDECALAGARVYAQVNVHEHFSTESFRSVLHFDHLPQWSEVRALPFDEQRVRLQDPAVRAALSDEAAELTRPGASRAGLGVAASRPLSFEEIAVLASPTPPYESVADVARARGVTPVEAMIDLALETDFHQMFGRTLLNFDRDAVAELISHPRTVLGVSDTGAHVTRVADSSYPTRLLAYWVRERELFGWEQAIAMLTSVPASRYGFTDRGYIREGLAADLVVFDPDTVGPQLPTVVHDFPTGAMSLEQKATGIAATVVNGQVHLRDGVPTGARAGRLLRGPLAREIGEG